MMSSMSNIHWFVHSFEEMSNLQLHEVWKLRQAVFIVEQNCPYMDIDGIDPMCHHIQGYIDQSLSCYARLIPPNNDIAKIGRVIVSPAYRHNGLGSILMQESERWMRQNWSMTTIQLDAQSHLLRFYQNLGYSSTGHEFLEDGIPHTRMKKTIG